MTLKPARSLAFPGGRPLKLAQNHPWGNISDGLRYAVTARGDGSIWEARSEKIIPPAGAGAMKGRTSAFGPAVYAAATSSGALYKVPVVRPTEPIVSLMMVSIQTVMTHNGGQAPVSLNYATSSAKTNYVAGGAGIQNNINGDAGTLFNPTALGDTYLFIGVWRQTTGNANRSYCVGLNLTTGQVEYQELPGSTQSITTASDYYGVYTYDGGTSDRNLFHAGAVFINGFQSPYWGSYPGVQDLLSTLENGNPFDFWYEPTAPSIWTLSQKNRPSADSFTFAASDAVDAASFTTNVTVVNDLALAASDALDRAAFSVGVSTNILTFRANDAQDKAAASVQSLPATPVTGPEYPPAPGGAPIDDVLVGQSPVGEVPAFDPWSVILSQYANSPIITGLALSWTAAIDPTLDLQAFFDNIWNIGQGVNGYGLDVWGRIVGLNRGRTVTVSQGSYFGFSEAFVSGGSISTFNFGLDRGFYGGGALYDGEPVTSNYDLEDDAFLLLIMAKAASNITDGSIPSINKILMSLFPNRGNCYVQESFSPGMYFDFAEADQGLGDVFGFNQASFYDGQSLGLNMQISYVFNFELTPIEFAVVTTSGVMPTPAGVKAIVVQKF